MTRVPNTIQHKRSTTASAVPTGASLSAGEIAINTADGRLFIKKSDGTVVAIGRDASELNTGIVAAARLPAATGSTLGAIVVGAGLGVSSGTVSVSYGSTGSTACVGNDSRLSDARTPLSHTHGNITNAGAIGSTANLPIITTTSGVLTVGSFGTTANTFCQGNDSRLSDTRTPTDGTVTTAKLADGAVTAAKIAASQALSVASVSATGNISSNTTVSGGGLSASTGGLTVSAGAIIIETLGAVTTFRVSSAGFITSGTWQGATIAVANGGTGATTAADARTNLGLTIGTNVQAYSSTLAAVSGGTYTGATSITTLGTITSGTWNGGTIAVANGGTGATTAANARTNLGVAYGSTAGTVCQGNDSRLGLSAWVNFDGTSTAAITGTYAQSGSTITVTTSVSHGLSAGQRVWLSFTSGTATTTGFVVAAVTSATVFTVTAGDSKTTSGNVTATRRTIRASYNVSSVAYLNTGDYWVNFSSEMTDANYAAIATCGGTSSAFLIRTYDDGSPRATWAVRVFCASIASGNAAIDPAQVSVAVFR